MELLPPSGFQLKTVDGTILEFRKTWRRFTVGREKDIYLCTVELNQDHYALCMDVQRDAQMMLRELETKGRARGWISLLLEIECYGDYCTLQKQHMVRVGDVVELLKWMVG